MEVMRKIVLVVAALLAVLQLVDAQPMRRRFQTASAPLTVSDAFNYTGSLSANWTTKNGSFSVNATNGVIATSANECGAYWNAATFNANQWAQITMKTVTSGQYVGVSVRGSTSGFYEFYASADTWYLAYYTTGYNQIATGSRTFAINDVLRFEISGSTITIKINGSLLNTWTDTHLTTGAPGISGYGSTAGCTGATWSGGNL